MAADTSITRRFVLKALGVAAAGAGAASVAVAEAVQPSPEVMAAIRNWNRTQDAKALAWQAWEATWLHRGDGKPVALRPHQVDLLAESRTHADWKRACSDADEAQLALLRELRETDLDIKAIYRRDAGR